MPPIDLNAARRLAGKPQGPQVLRTLEMQNLHEPGSVRIGDRSYNCLYQISPSLELFRDPLSCFWAWTFSERADGTLQFPSEAPPPFGWKIQKVKLLKPDNAETLLVVPMRSAAVPVEADATARLYRFSPPPGTVIHKVTLQSWMGIEDGNLEQFETWMAEHPDDAFFNPDAQLRMEAIMAAQLAFLEAQERGESGGSGSSSTENVAPGASDSSTEGSDGPTSSD